MQVKGCVRMNSRRGVNTAVGAGYLGRFAAGLEIDADCHDCGDPHLQGPLNDSRDGIGEFREIQVSMRIDQLNKLLHILGLSFKETGTAPYRLFPCRAMGTNL